MKRDYSNKGRLSRKNMGSVPIFHDWYIILSDTNMLQYDTMIAGIVKALGWIIMIAAIAGLAIRAIENRT